MRTDHSFKLTNQIFKTRSRIPVYHFTFSCANNSKPSLVNKDPALNDQITLNGFLFLNDENLMMGLPAPPVSGLSAAAERIIFSDYKETSGDERKILCSTSSYLFSSGNLSEITKYSPTTLTFTSVNNTINAFACDPEIRKSGSGNLYTNNFSGKQKVSNSSDTNAGDNINLSCMAREIKVPGENMIMGKFACMQMTKCSLAQPDSNILLPTGSIKNFIQRESFRKRTSMKNFFTS